MRIWRYLSPVVCVVSLALLGIAAPSFAANWVYYYQREGEKYYYDRSMVPATIQEVVTVSQRVVELGSGDKEKEIRIETVEMNCKLHKYRVVKVVNTADKGDGKDVVKGTTAVSGEWLWFSLESMMASLYENICQKQQSTWFERHFGSDRKKTPAKTEETKPSKEGK